MSVSATDRHHVSAAPGGLRIVQDFVNTDGGRQADLLGDVDTAREWARSVLAERAEATGVPTPALVLTDRDLVRLTELRVRIRQALHHQGDDADNDWIVGAGVTAGLRQSADGTVVISPQGAGWKLVASLLLVESLAAQEAKLWPRLKACRNERCQVAFYDRSRNNSGVWHDVLICGNAINLRTSRARRRAAATDAETGA